MTSDHIISLMKLIAFDMLKILYIAQKRINKKTYSLFCPFIFLMLSEAIFSTYIETYILDLLFLTSVLENRDIG